MQIKKTLALLFTLSSTATFANTINMTIVNASDYRMIVDYAICMSRPGGGQCTNSQVTINSKKTGNPLAVIPVAPNTSYFQVTQVVEKDETGNVTAQSKYAYYKCIITSGGVLVLNDFNTSKVICLAGHIDDEI